MSVQSPTGVDRRRIEQQATAQLTTLTSLLASFAFLWFTTLADREPATPLSLALLIGTALAIFTLLLASVMGALLTIASEAGERKAGLVGAEMLWGYLTKAGIVLFLASAGLLPFLVDRTAGMICAALAAATAVAVIVVWGWIKGSMN